MMYNVSLLTMGFSNQWKMLWKSMSHSKMGCYNLSVRFNCEWTPALEMSGVWGAQPQSQILQLKRSQWKSLEDTIMEEKQSQRNGAQDTKERELF